MQRIYCTIRTWKPRFQILVKGDEEFATNPNSKPYSYCFSEKPPGEKSSLINAISSQKISLVSDTKGTTTDPVYKAMEIHPLGPCLLIDTAGFDDNSVLGEQRSELTKQVIEKTDIAVILFCDE